MKYKILVADPLSKEGTDILKNCSEFQVDVHTSLTPLELLNIIAEYDAILIRSMTKVNSSVIKKAAKLKLIGRAGVGVDNVDVDAATKANITVMTAPHGNTVSAAEHAISLLMSLVRQIPQANASIKGGSWAKSNFKGTEVCNKTLGLIGLGNIGSVVAKLAQGLQMRVVAFDPYATKENAQKLGVDLVSLEKLYPQADFISIHVPLTTETNHLINEDAFSQMKQGVFIVNAARGGIVDENALLKALNSGKVNGAALDVFEIEPPDLSSELIKHANFIATPHLGASTKEAQNRVSEQIAEQTCDFFLKKIITNSVN